MEISAKAMLRTTRIRHVLLNRIGLFRKPPLQVVRPDNEGDIDHKKNLFGIITDTRTSAGLSIEWYMHQPFDRASSSYTATLNLTADDLGAIVTAATRDPMLGELIRKKVAQQPAQRWELRERYKWERSDG